MRRIKIVGLMLALLLSAEIPTPAETVSVTVDNTMAHQTMEGFGATHLSGMLGRADTLTPAQRAQAIDALFNQVQLRTGQVPGLLEAPATAPDPWAARANDNSDPFNLNWNGFNSEGADLFRQTVVDGAPPETVANLYPSTQINVRWASPWLANIRSADYNRFLDECAEQVLAGILYWTSTYGREPSYAMLFNEPTSGNGELAGGTTQQVVDITKRAGARLRAAGFNAVQFVVPGEETESRSLSVATALLADPEARPYVGAIAYHPYPYGSTYSYIPNILRTSGAGRPDPGSLALRHQLRELGRAYGVPVWMTEVSHGYFASERVDPDSFNVLRGRAIHIHDELVYADAAAFFGMMSLWSSNAQQAHFGDRLLYGSADDIVLVDNDADRVFISGMGYAIGHYARAITQGAVRIEAISDDPLLQVTAFRDDNQGQFVLVAINNAAGAMDVDVRLNALTLAGDLTGEQSTAEAYWQPLAAFAPDTPSGFRLTVPALSVTTVAGLIEAAMGHPARKN